MSWNKIKPRQTDINYSKYIRRGGKCEICGRSDIRLEAAHYHGRRKESVRFDDRNVHCICSVCHRKCHEPGYYYKDWLIGKYGQKWYDKLTIDANRTCKRDDKMQAIINNELLKQCS